jgi:HSP20 family protein
MRYGLTSRDLWSPAQEFLPWLNVVDEFLKPDSTQAYKPACDVEETDSHFLMNFDLPGVSKEDVKIEVFEKQLTISGIRKAEKKEEKNLRLVKERNHGNFERIFTLPSTIDSSKVEASYTDGVLQIALPKAESAKPRQVKISGEKEA